MSAESGNDGTHRDNTLTQSRVPWPPATKPYIGSAPDLPIETQYVALKTAAAHFLDQAFFGTSVRLSAARVS